MNKRWHQLWVALVLLGCTKHPITGGMPVLKKVTPSSATINWTTSKPVKGRIQWKGEEERGNIITEKERTTSHCITLQGLIPEKIYTYSINTIPDTHFTFRTAPQKGSPFRFCIINESDFSIENIEAFYPDFIVLRNNSNVLKTSRLQYVNSQIPVLSGPARFMWSNACILLDPAKDISSVDSNLIIVVSDTYPKPTRIKNTNVSPIVFQTSTDSFFIDTNASFVSTGLKSICVEVQGDEVKAGFGRDCNNLNFLIRKGTITFEKTCILCRRLMEKKYYKRSIENYQRFILENPAQKLHDNALYQISFIYDMYLSDFQKAMRTYAHLIDSFPQSQLSKIAEIRLHYLKSHSDYNFKPLTAFEKYKNTYNNKKDIQSLTAIERLLEEYTHCSIRDEVILWLGTQYSVTNWKKSIELLKKLTHDTIPDDVFYAAAFKIGSVLYNSKQYKRSEAYHKKLLKKYPEKAPVLQRKIDRSIRNQKRESISFYSILLIAGVTLITFFMGPVGFSLNYMKSVFFTVCIYGFTAILIYGLFYESLKKTIHFTLTTTFLMIIITFVSRQLLYKLASKDTTKLINSIVSGLVMLLLTSAALYISLKQFHYLFVFERMFQ